MRAILSAIGLFLLAATAAHAEGPHFGQIAYAVEGGTSAQSSFAPDTPKIVLHVQLMDMPEGTKITADWIAAKTDAAPPNFKIDSATTELSADIDQDETSFSLSKPNAGWPVGDYKVDLAIDGEVVLSAPFHVVKR